MNDLEEYKAYIQNRKSSFKRNYHKESLRLIDQLKQREQRPKLLLHACCVVCACWPLDLLSDTFDITILFNNSNIWPQEEYTHRLNELKRYIHERWNDSIEIVEFPYDNVSYTEDISFGKDEPEGWKRCFYCYEKRMDECFSYAEQNGFDYFTTVMTFSRQKDSQVINEIGQKLEKKYTHTKYFCSDFKKADGQIKSNAICDQYDLYRQNYCGCIFSWQGRHSE